MGGAQLRSALERYREQLAALRLPLDLPGAEAARRLAGVQADQLDDYLIPRLNSLEAPLLAVVGGSTGAGKSTLVNSLLGRVVSAPGVIRPTTRSAVLVHHPVDAEAFADQRILPGLARSPEPGDVRTLQVVPEFTIGPGLAILDAPDVDSVVRANRDLASQLLAAADLWLFVTSAARYADAVPWEYLREAAARSAVVAVVVDRVPAAAMAEVPAHLGQMMVQRGLAGSPLFAVPETDLDSNGLLPDAAVAPIREWLAGIAVDADSRRAVVQRTLDGALSALIGDGQRLVDAVGDQHAGLAVLREDAEKAWAEAVRTVGVQTADGTMLRGEVLSRWQDFVGTGELVRDVERRIGWVRDRVMAGLTGRPAQAARVTTAVESGLAVLITEETDAAHARTRAAWLAHPAGRLLASAMPGHEQGSVAALVRGWQDDVLDLVRSQGAGKRSRARYLALGVNGVGVALMVVVFSQTGGLAGAEIGIAGGTALLAQRVLEAVFGDDAVRRLARQAKDALDARVQAYMAHCLDPWLSSLDGLALGELEPLRDALAEIERHRGDLGVVEVSDAH